MSGAENWSDDSGDEGADSAAKSVVLKRDRVRELQDKMAGGGKAMKPNLMAAAALSSSVPQNRKERRALARKIGMDPKDAAAAFVPAAAAQHPSWAAKAAGRARESVKRFEGKRTRFGSDSD